MRLFVPTLCLVLLLAAACTPKAAVRDAPPAPVETVTNFEATALVYFSLQDNMQVGVGEDWDLSFSSTTLRVNGEVLLLDEPFDAVTEAPKDGYADDTGAQPVIASGSGNGWYLYDASVHSIQPVPDRTLIIKTEAGTYAKVEILSYYRLLEGEEQKDAPRYYTFRYVHQPDGSRRLQ